MKQFKFIVTCLCSVLLLLTLSTIPLTAQTITEILNGTGDGAGNTLSGPNGIAVDCTGNVYVTGSSSDNVFKITPGGIITEIIDATGDGIGNILDYPWDIAVDGSGNTYVTSFNTNTVFKITPVGIITVILDATGDGAGNTLNKPFGVATDDSDNVYVSGYWSDNVFKITPSGIITVIIDSTGNGAGNTLDVPTRIAVDGSANVFVVAKRPAHVFKITPSGNITEIIDATGDGAGNPLESPNGITKDDFGNVFVVGEGSNNVFKITPSGNITEIIDVTGDGAGNMLDEPVGRIDADGSGNVYVSGVNTNNAFKITPNGIITQIIDATGDGVGKTFEAPTGVTVDCSGNVYVTANNTNNVFKITPAGVSTVKCINSPFGMFEISPEVELYGSGDHVDTIEFWKASDVNESLMFVTAKDNSLVEVWKYPFDTDDEQTPLTHSSFISGAQVNGVQVDSESNILFVSIGRPSNSISVFSLPDLQFVTNFNSNGAYYHREPNLTLLKLPNGDKQLYVSADDEVFIHNVTDVNSPDFGDFIGSFNDLPEIETLQADNYYQNIIIPDEQDRTGVYAFYPDGSQYPTAGDNNFGNNAFQKDAEGILLYNCTEEDQGEGFFVVTDQLYTQSEFEFFDRTTWAHYGTMKIDDVDNSAGVASFPYPVPGYPMGIFATTDDDNSVVLVSWEKIFTRIENITNVSSTCVIDYFETFQLTLEVELYGSGDHVDTIEFWKASDVNESLMFVTAKDNSLVEVWKYPFDTDDEQTPLTHSSFISGAQVNGVQVDSESNILFVSIGRPSNSISVFSLPDLQFVTNFNSNGAYYHREPNLTLLKLPNGDKQLYVSADDEVFIHNVTDVNSPDFGDFIGSFNDLPEIETLQADNYYQNIIIPDEQDRTGVYAFYPDGSQYPTAGDNNFGNNAFQKDAEGILLYNCTEEDQGEGFFVVTDQLYTQSEFEFFDRATWAHYGTMKIDDVDNSAGVASFPYPVPGYPMGIFATTDDDNSVVLVSWEKIFTEIQINKSLPKILIASGEEIPIEYSLNQNYPNPFNPVTTISYSLPLKSQVELVVYNTLGEEVKQLVYGVKEAGSYSVELNATALPSGIYFYQLRVENFIETKKMILMK